jgi:hypothetical protein
MLAHRRKTEVGSFWIKPDKKNGWSLEIGHNGDWELLGSYSTAVAAADDVFTQHTGYSEWDDPGRSDSPTDLGEWEKKNI